MESELSQFIAQLQTIAPIWVKDLDQLILALQQLQALIAMDDIKRSIIEQLKFLIVNKGSTDGHMLHCVLSGAPGAGKTTVARILAKIWSSLGCIKKSTAKGKKPDIPDYQLGVIKYYNERISKLETTIENLEKNTTAISNSVELIRRSAIDRDYETILSQLRSLPKANDQDIKTDSAPIPFVIATRENLVGEFLGKTAIKTKEVLDSARGGVLFIDECYSLCMPEKDNYGEECLTVINEYMSLYPDELIVIFGGYKEKIEQSIFKVQPGLKRRISWYFEIKTYTSEDLGKILRKLADDSGWSIGSFNIEKMLDVYSRYLEHGGGSMEQLLFYSKLAYGNKLYDNKLYENVEITENKTIDQAMIKDALGRIKKQHDEKSYNSKVPSYVS